ncbi:efflux RND transporter periplasmic adaptor subunit [Roseimaritima ulvae]|uniref:Multidrug resistance protein MdtA n=1 Tax=Roseimaritima ulvae TaxID=980254 RepID=A0A5B9QYN5_9BACT|nr:efflux RND transporter periplasmic adaptor subunit [Roseimaritima ulvae]QEG39063.1 Multidrug resistance protein MdtA precursor [Roseimaritima ulvae]
MNEAGHFRQRRSWLSVITNAVLCLSILGGSGVGVWWIYQTEPEAQQINAKRKSQALVETVVVERNTYSPRLVVLGTVEPAQDIVLSPRVRGQVLELSPSFAPGGMVRKGELLLRIDPADFENTVSIRRSELEQVEADWKIEDGRQKLAKQELDLLGDSIGEINAALVLREPQSASLQSRLSAARAAVQRAVLDLERTEIFAPFDAQILDRSVNVGSQVQPGDELGQLVGIDQYWVMAAVPIRNLRWIQFPEEGKPGSQVRLQNPDAWGDDAYRVGRVARMIGSLDQQTRLARVLVVVDDPLGLQAESHGLPPLILDSLLKVQIAGREIDDVVRLHREYVHDGDTVWVMQDGELEIRNTEIEFRDPEFAYISSGLESGDEVVTTTLATVANGVKLRKVESPAETVDSGDAEPDAEVITTDSPDILEDADSELQTTEVGP